MGALQYIAKRIGTYLLVLFIGISITFLLPRLMPANPIEAYIGQLQARANGTLTTEAIEAMRASLQELYGLKGNIFTQYLSYHAARDPAFRLRPVLCVLSAIGQCHDHECLALDAWPVAGLDR